MFTFEGNKYKCKPDQLSEIVKKKFIFYFFLDNRVKHALFYSNVYFCCEKIICNKNEGYIQVYFYFTNQNRHIPGLCARPWLVNTVCSTIHPTNMDVWRTKYVPVLIQGGWGVGVECMDSIKFLSIHISSDLFWTVNTSCLV